MHRMPRRVVRRQGGFVRANLAPDLAYLAERPETDEATIGTYPGKPCRGPRQGPGGQRLR
jgi:hypothetical protein